LLQCTGCFTKTPAPHGHSTACWGRLATGRKVQKVLGFSDRIQSQKLHSFNRKVGATLQRTTYRLAKGTIRSMKRSKLVLRFGETTMRSPGRSE